ncbi:MAG TPA: cellulase family glycosylhydrolase [Gemmatimonadales bacterium]|nr:cellulase family glycosylhydrolase [Gemmatimonadales bacterium]
MVASGEIPGMLLRTHSGFGPGFAATVLAVAACAHPVVAPAPLPTVPATRLARLARAANITQWSTVVRQTTWSPRGHDLTDADAALIRGMGFSAVRLVVPLGQVFNPAIPDRPDSTALAHLDAVLDRLLAHDLGVIVEPHPSSKNRRIETDSVYADHFVRFWSAFAGHLSRRDPERLFLEVMNEPVFDRRERDWGPVQARLLAAMRAAAPAHTLIASGTGWSSIDGLLRLTPVADGNVVYTFHFYEPMILSHQGEQWAQPPAGKLRSLPYPVDSVGCAAFAASQQDSSAARATRRYCAQGWNAAVIGRRLGQAAAWGREHKVPVFLGEFGASAATARPDAREAWLRDVRMTAERLGMGWAIWSFDDHFGLAATPDPDGSLRVDASVVRALGLRLGGAEISRAR